MGDLVAAIVSFGDSFIWGSEIPGNGAGELAWPGLIAKRLGHTYETRAEPGCGNGRILRQILTWANDRKPEPVLAVINWTWSSRWDVFKNNPDQWVTVGPSCTPDTLLSQVGHETSERWLEFYHNHVKFHAVPRAIDCLKAIATACWVLDQMNIPSVQTYMEHSIFADNFSGSIFDVYQQMRAKYYPEWPECASKAQFQALPRRIQQKTEYFWQHMEMPAQGKMLQDLLRNRLQTWQGMNFLDWCQQRGHEITPAPGLHPLARAHEDAADFWFHRYAQTAPR